MKNLVELQAEVQELNVEGLTFTVSVRENNWENTGDANYSDDNSYDSLEEAYKAFSVEVKSGFLSDSEYREVELIAINDEEGVFEVLESDSKKMQYTEGDYGKLLISYRDNNNGIEGISIQEIDESTPYVAAEDRKFAVKFQIEETKEGAISFIYNKMLYISMEDAAELFEMSLR